MPDCPTCGTVVDASHRECSACGCTLDGATTPFEPIRDVDAEQHSPLVEGAPALVVRKGPQAGERFFVDQDEITIGRDPGCDVFLNDITVSRRHATLRMAAGVVSIEDAGSLNGTYVNGVRVDEAVIGEGDTVQIGKFVMGCVSGGRLT